MNKNNDVESIVIRLAGDSGDGIQLMGSQFAVSTALAGADFATFPDYPAEIRAPIGTTFGVSAYQINLGGGPITTPGDAPEVLVAFNPAALRVSLPMLDKGALVVINNDTFTDRNLAKAGYDGDPREDGTLNDYQVVAAYISHLNLEAVKEIAYQIRLRDIGGLIIIDFIDMTDPDHRRQVLRALEKCLSQDHARTHISEVSSLGLVEMTRKRIRESLEHILCEPCTCCAGRGSLKTAETTCYEIFREILREARQFDVESLLVLASQEVIDRLLDEESTNLAELEQFIGRPIRLQAEALYTQEQYDVVLI